MKHCSVHNPVFIRKMVCCSITMYYLYIYKHPGLCHRSIGQFCNISLTQVLDDTVDDCDIPHQFVVGLSHYLYHSPVIYQWFHGYHPSHQLVQDFFQSSSWDGAEISMHCSQMLTIIHILQIVLYIYIHHPNVYVYIYNY